MLTIKLAAILAFVALVTARPMSCPTAEHLFPCTCRRWPIGLHITCANINKSDDLVRSFKVLKHYQITNVLLHGLYIKDVLPSDLFDGLDIVRLTVEKSQLAFSDPAFKGLDASLHTLNVAQHSMIKSTEDYSIARLTMLTELSIKSNPVGLVRDQWLNGKIPNIHTVILDKDEITKVESNAFAKLPKLTKISMALNQITKIERSMLPRPAAALESIDLSWNSIEYLPYDFLFDMPVLKEVVLSGNSLKTLEKNVWITVWEKLETVLLVSNKIVCNDELNWLRGIPWPYTVEGDCASPTNLENKPIKQVYTT